MRYDNIVFDMLNIYYRAGAVQTNTPLMTTINNEKIDIKGIAGSIQMILKRINNYLVKENGHVYFLFDNATTSQTRQEAFDVQYKANRKKMPKSFYRGFDYLEVILRNFCDNGHVIRITSMEADDLVKPVLRNTKDSDFNLLVSTDMDWSRSISDKTHWLRSGDIVDKDQFEADYGFPVSESNVTFYKTFYGDTVDNIKGALTQFPKVYFKSVIENYTDIKDFVFDVLQKKISYLDDGWIKRIDRDKSLLYKNWNLVSFQPISDIELERYTTNTQFNEFKLKVLYETLHIIGCDKRIKKQEKDILNDIFSDEKLPWKK